MKNLIESIIHRLLLFLLVVGSLISSLHAYSPKPDLIAAGVIAALKADANSSPLYTESYNLGPTGLRGWMYRDPANMGQEGLQTNQDRQILITAVGAGTPAASAGLAVDDVILGIKAGSGSALVYPANVFTTDSRKAFGAAITEAETTAKAGVVRILRWRAGVFSEVQLNLTVMGDYAATAPYNCPKSAAILATAIARLDSETSTSMTGGWSDAAKALALMAAVKPTDANYNAVRQKVQNYAHNIAPANLSLSGCNTWDWGYMNIFLSEYYLRTVADGAPDATALSGINKYTTALAKGQSKYGTFGHGGAEQHADGSLHGSISWYGPVNSAGLVANLGIVLGKKALMAGGIALDPEIDPAIERGSNFFAYFANKGGIPYGEHEPWSGGHASNGKDSMAAVMFALQGNRPVETEYFTRMSVAGWVGREYGHTGQGFSYLWSALGAAMGGDEAAAAHLNQVRWHLDLERRSDGSFVYDGGEQYGGSETVGYFGSSSYYGLSPNACFVLTYSLPLKRLLITGRDALPQNTLNTAKVTNAVAAGPYDRDCVGYSVATLLAAFSEYDPVVRHDAAAQMAAKSLSAAELNVQIALITNGTMSPDPNVRQAVCETMGIRKPTEALSALSQRLSDTDLWVRGKASNALKNYGSAASSQVNTMLTAFTANATDPDVIVWDDPIQIANGYLADTLFQAMADNTYAADKQTLLYPALRAGLRQPDGMARMYLGSFLKNKLTQADVLAVAPSIVAAVAERSPADRMFSDVIRYDALNTLAKYKIEEGIPLCLLLKEQTWHGDDWDPFTLLQNTYRGAAKDALPTLYKWQDHIPQFAADGSIGGCCPGRLDNITNKIASTIAAIETDPSPPTLLYLKSMTASASPASFTMPTTQTTLVSNLIDQDQGSPKLIWSKLSGAGAVSFNAVPSTTNYTATFNTPGKYKLKVAAVDGSILDYNNWITYSLGYYDFQTYNETLAAVTQTVDITILPDSNRAPVPQNQGLATPANTGLAVTLAATDSNGDPLTYSVVAPPGHGSLSGVPPNLTYTPALNYNGLDSFTFKANDGKVDSVSGTVTIDVGSVTNRRPVAVNQYVSTAEETAVAVTLSGTDADGNPLIYEIVGAPGHGTLSGTVPNLSYQPAANYPVGNFNATDSFTFTVRDATLTSAVATVSITLTPVNDAPIALAQSKSVSANSSNPITLLGLDAEGYALQYSIASNPGHGILTGTAPNLIYEPTTNYRGADSFTFTVTDSENTVSASATVSINVINDPPVANPQSVELPPDLAKSITLSGSDASNDPLTFVVLSQPTNGNLTGTAPNLTYTPTPGYTGTDSFTFKVNDGVTDSPSAVVSLNVLQWQTWTNLAPGNWSAGASWAGGVAPVAGGSSLGMLIFNTTPTGISSNDLAGTFALNRANFSSSLPVLTVSGNALSFGTNNGTLPQINQGSNNNVTLSHGLTLSANTVLGGIGSGELFVSGKLSGAGSLTKNSSGNLTISGLNTATTPTPAFSGGITINVGQLTLGNKTGVGTGILTMAGGTTLRTTGFEGNSSGGALSNAFQLSGGLVNTLVSFGVNKDVWISGPVSGPGGFLITGDGRDQGLTLAGAKSFTGGVTLGTVGTTEGPNVSIDNATSLGSGVLRSELRGTTLTKGGIRLLASITSGSGVSNPIELAPSARLVVNTQAFNLLLSGPITNSGSLVKIGTGTLTLSSVGNTYSGTTTINGGTLTCNTATSLGKGPLVISSSGSSKLNLNFAGTRQVTSLSLGGVAQANGTYGSTASPATNKNNTYFSGTGTLTVIPASSISLALSGGVTPAVPGDPLTFTATVAGASPTGNVSFYDGATLMSSTALDGSAQASITTSSLATGMHSITAQYVGNAGNGASTSTVLTILVGVPVTATNLLATADTSVHLTWTAASGAIGYFVKRSTVSGGPYVTVGSVSDQQFHDTPSTSGITYYYVVTAVNNAGESLNSVEASATPNALPSSTTLAKSPLVSTGVYGTTMTFTATVVVSGGSASGIVLFKDGSTVLGAGALVSGTANFVTGNLDMGTYSISAYYVGDATFASSVSSPTSYAITAKPLTLSGITAADKIYDATNIATLSGGTLTGVLAGETVTSVPGSGTFASANAGNWAVTASGYSLGGTDAGNYSLLAQPSVPNATINPRPVQLSGSRSYDGTILAAAGILTIANNLDGANLTLTGSANISEKNVGSSAILGLPGRVRVSSGDTGINTAASLLVNMGVAPANGNTLVAVIATRGTSTGRVTGISQTGATWTRVSQGSNAGGSTTEIWITSNVSGAAATLTISQAALRSAAVVIEYSGILSTSPLDKVANTSGNSVNPSTGTTVSTVQANELWIGGTGLVNSGYSLSASTNSFASIASAQSISTTASNNAKVYALERVTTAIGAAGTVGTTTSSQWSGAIATLKAAASTSTLTLTGSAAGNYTLRGASGSVAVNARALSVTAPAVASKSYNALPSVGAITVGTLSGFVGSETVTATATASPYPSANVGTYLANVISYTLANGTNGGLAENYSLANGSASGAITARTLTLTAQPNTKEYDGGISAAAVPIHGALQGSDTVTGMTEVYDNKNFGTGKTLAVSGYTVNDGNGGNNYSVTTVPNNAGVINKKSLSVTAVMASKIYDGTTTAAGVPVISPTLAQGDTTNVLSQSFANPTAGQNNKEIIPNIVINDGNSGGNYLIALNHYNFGIIAPAVATITLGDLSHNYDGNAKNASASTTPSGLPVILTYVGAPTPPVAVGTYLVEATINHANYTGTASATLAILAAGETIATWRNAHFSVAEISGGLADDGDDFDGDGFDHVAEYTFGTDPKVFTPPILIGTSVPSNQFNLSFLARSAVGTGYTGRTRKYTLQKNTNIADQDAWQNVAGYVDVVGAGQSISASLPLVPPRTYFRLNARLE